jgi:hypothetical protein
MGQQVTNLKNAIVALAEAGSNDGTKLLLGNPANPPVPMGSPMSPDSVELPSGSIKLKLFTLMGSMSAAGKWVRVRCIPTAATQDVQCTWDGSNNYATTGLLGQITPSTDVDDYEVVKLSNRGTGWENETPIETEFEGVGLYLEGTVIAKLNELIEQYNQLRTDYNNGIIPTTATAVTTLPV